MVECCNTPDVTFHLCNSNSCHFRLCDMIFPPWLGFVFCFSFYFMSCISYHIITCISFAYVFVSCIRTFSPLSVSQSDTPTCTGAPLLSSFVVRVLNILGMDRALPSGPGIAPVDHLSSFGSFGARLVLQQLTALPQRPLLCCSPTPLQTSPITHLTPLHALGRSITIVWVKTTPHLDSSSSFYLYKHLPLRNFGSKP